MQKGWDAEGLLAPLWRRYPGGRDHLAAAVGTTGSALSSVNSGKRNLGADLARRLATELGVSVLELGAPEAEADDRESQLLRDRLEAVEAELATERRRFDRFVRATTARLAALEEARATPGRRSARQPKGGAAR